MALANHGQKVFLTFDTDSYSAFGDPHSRDTWIRAHAWAADKFKDLVQVVNPVNEPDGEGFESSRMSVDEVNQIIHIAYDAWPRDVLLVGVGSVSGQVSYYDRINTELLDGIDFHPYAKYPPSMSPAPGYRLENIIDEHAALGMPMWISEIGQAGREPLGELGQATFLRETIAYLRSRTDVAASMIFCAHPYDGWGLWRPDGSLKLAYDAFKTAAMREKQLYGYAYGFAEIAAVNRRIVGEPLENEVYPWHGVSHQRTTNGFLWWADSGEGAMGFVDHDGLRFIWKDGALQPMGR